MKLIVVGAGAAGLAAAFRAQGRAEVTVVHGRAGATALYAGALDVGTWGELPSSPINETAREFIKELGLWSVPGQVVLATQEGQLRWASGADAAILDLDALASKKIGVCDLGRAAYEARAWVRSLSQTSWCERTGTAFVAVETPRLFSERSQLCDYDFAQCFDDPEQVEMLADGLAASEARVDAWLLPPSLGIARPARARLQARLGVPVGECLHAAGGAAGARFEHARDGFLTRCGARVLRGEVVSLELHAEEWKVTLRDANDALQTLSAERVVLAPGGLVAGALRLSEPGQTPGLAFELAFAGPVRLALDGRAADEVSSLHGLGIVDYGLGALWRVGIEAPAGRVLGTSGLFAAGDIVSGTEKSVLRAISAGLRVADLALAV